MQDAPMIVGEASTTVRASPNEVFDFVIDLERYRQADHKIGRVGDVRRDGDRGTVQFSGRIRGLPGPSGTYPFTLDESRLVFGTPIAGPARWFLASFERAASTARPRPRERGSPTERHTDSKPRGGGWRSRSYAAGSKATPPTRWSGSRHLSMPPISEG